MITDKQLQDILNDMVIVCDTREQKNQHILEYFDSIGQEYVHEKMESADYTFYLPTYNNLGLDWSVLVERKNSWDEIIGNFTKNRERFVNEFERMRESDIVHIVIEDATWGQLIKGSYRSQLPPKNLMANVMTWNLRYNVNFWLARRSESPLIIHNLLYYGLREQLRELQKNG